MFVVHHAPKDQSQRYYAVCSCGCEFVVEDDEFETEHLDSDHPGCAFIRLISGQPSVMCPDCNNLISKEDNISPITFREAQEYYKEAVTSLY